MNRKVDFASIFANTVTHKNTQEQFWDGDIFSYEIRPESTSFDIASSAAHSKRLLGCKSPTVNTHTITLACVRSLLIREWL